MFLQLTVVGGYRSLCGRENDGRFRTVHAKEYPSALRTLVVALLTGLRYRFEREGACPIAQMTVEEQSWVRALLCKAEDLSRGTFLPDYRRD